MKRRVKETWNTTKAKVLVNPSFRSKGTPMILSFLSHKSLFPMKKSKMNFPASKEKFSKGFSYQKPPFENLHLWLKISWNYSILENNRSLLKLRQIFSPEFFSFIWDVAHSDMRKFWVEEKKNPGETSVFSLLLRYFTKITLGVVSRSVPHEGFENQNWIRFLRSNLQGRTEVLSLPFPSLSFLVLNLSLAFLALGLHLVFKGDI